MTKDEQIENLKNLVIQREREAELLIEALESIEKPLDINLKWDECRYFEVITAHIQAARKALARHKTHRGRK